MIRNQIILAFVLVIAILAGVLVSNFIKNDDIAKINDFESCGKLYPVLELYPRMCKTPDGRTFKESIGNEIQKENLIRIESPRPNDIVESPLVIRGQARGSWYFEAQFPVRLSDENGQILSQVGAQAEKDWMTEDFVPFTATLEFGTTTSKTGTLTLIKDNPSGDPTKDDYLEIPVKFK